MSRDSEPTPEFSDAERRAIRRMLEADARMAWLWASLRVWAMWIAAVVGGGYAAYTFLRDAVRSLGTGN